MAHKVISNLNIGQGWVCITGTQGILYVHNSTNTRSSSEYQQLYDDLNLRLSVGEAPEELFRYLGRDEFSALTIVFQQNDRCVLKSDVIRSVPILYQLKDDVLTVSDQPHCMNSDGIGMDQLLEFIATGYVFGPETVYNGISAIQSSEIVYYLEGKLSANRYFRYLYNDMPLFTSDSDRVSVTAELDRILTAVFNDCAASLSGGSRIVVPLSGGHDSRIVVNYLYKLGYRNVICYSYGLPGNLQSEISRKLAMALGYEWHFVEYNEASWLRMHENGTVDHFIKSSNRGISTPHLQDFLAVMELKEKGVLRADDLFMPGHGLDYLAGFELSEEDFRCKSGQDAISLVLKNCVDIQALNREQVAELYNRVSGVYNYSDIPPDQFQEYFFWQEDEAKFIINSVDVYRHAGFSYSLPFFDMRLIRFWLSVSRDIKMGRKLFLEIARSLHVDEIKEIPVDIEIVKYNKTGWYKKLIPSYLHVSLNRLLKRKAKLAEGMNLIYAGKADSVEALIGPVDAWPAHLRPWFANELRRYPYQIGVHFLTRLYTVKKEFL